jgi:maltose-binding protein MalE
MMKLPVLSTLTALMLSGAFAVQAQTSTGTSTDTSTSPSTSSSTTGSATASSKDGAQALEQAKKACKSETSPQAQQDCMKKAQDDYKASMKAKGDVKSEPAKQ